MVLPKQFVPIEVHNNNGDHDFDQNIDTIQFVGCSDVLMVVPCWTHSFLEKKGCRAEEEQRGTAGDDREPS